MILVHPICFKGTIWGLKKIVFAMVFACVIPKNKCKGTTIIRRSDCYGKHEKQAPKEMSAGFITIGRNGRILFYSFVTCAKNVTQKSKCKRTTIKRQRFFTNGKRRTKHKNNFSRFYHNTMTGMHLSKP